MPVVKPTARVVLALVRGDDRLDEMKLLGALGEDFRPADHEEIQQAFGAVGRLDRPGRRLGGGDRGRDAARGPVRRRREPRRRAPARRRGRPRLRAALRRPARAARRATAARSAAGALQFQTAIEVGHIFKLDTRLLGAARGDLPRRGRHEKRPFVMGSYGIGPGADDGGDRRAAPRRAGNRLAAVGGPVRCARGRAARRRGAGGRGSRASSTRPARTSSWTTATSARARSSPTPT